MFCFVLYSQWILFSQWGSVLGWNCFCPECGHRGVTTQIVLVVQMWPCLALLISSHPLHSNILIKVDIMHKAAKHYLASPGYGLGSAPHQTFGCTADMQVVLHKTPTQDKLLPTSRPPCHQHPQANLDRPCSLAPFTATTHVVPVNHGRSHSPSLTDTTLHSRSLARTKHRLPLHINSQQRHLGGPRTYPHLPCLCCLTVVMRRMSCHFQVATACGP